MKCTPKFAVYLFCGIYFVNKNFTKNLEKTADFLRDWPLIFTNERIDGHADGRTEEKKYRRTYRRT